MALVFVALAILVLAAPTFAQKLPAPQFNITYAEDISAEVDFLGYCLALRWDAVDGAGTLLHPREPQERRAQVHRRLVS